MNALEIKGLCKSYSDFKLDNLSLSLPSGSIMGLIGENGAGKSTTIKLILDMIHRDGGYITIFGVDNTSDIKLLKEDIGVVMDEAGIPQCLTATQVGRIMKHTFKNWDSEEYTRLIKKLSIPEKKPFKELSRGNRMKLGIAIAMSHGAKLLLLDEPTSGLDPVVRDEVIEMFYDFTKNKNNSILISSHIVSDLEKLCDYVAFLHNGKLLLCEKKDELLSEYGILHCTRDQLSSIDASAIKYKKETPYGFELIVKREAFSTGDGLRTISIEELFLFMVKEAR